VSTEQAGSSEAVEPGLPASPWLHRVLDRVRRERSRLDFDQAETSENTDDRLLQATLQQLLHSPLQVISKGLRTTTLDEIESGLRSKASRRFGGSKGLALFALTETIRPSRSGLTDVLIDSAAQALIDPAAEHHDVALRLGKTYFNAVCDDPCLTFQTFAWLAAREDAGLREQFADLYQSLDSRVTDGFDLYLASWGRRPNEDITTTEIAVAITSLIEGLAMRTAVYPDSVSESLAAKSALAMICGMTTPVTDG